MTPAAGDALDGVTLDDLGAQLGDDVLERILAAYLDELPRYLGELHAALERADAEVVVRAAHSLKGASLLIGGEPLGAACETIENAAKAGDLATAGRGAALVDELAVAAEAAVRARMAR